MVGAAEPHIRRLGGDQRNLADRPRRLATVQLACGFWALIRTGGITGDGYQDYPWRWAESAEDRLLAEAADDDVAALVSLRPAAGSGAQAPEWPGFRGPDRDGIIRGVQIETDWSTSPPRELWRRQIGPGWSSFAVHGNRLYTQEQRGDDWWSLATI